MRYLALATYLAAGLWGLGLTELAGCGAAPPRPTARTVGVALARDLSRDLADARAAAPAVPPEHRDALPARDPRVVDLDIIRITAHTRAPDGEPELTSVASADLFRQAGAAATAGRRREAVGLYRIAALYDGEADLTATLTTLEELVAKYPASRESVDGQLYIAALQAD